MRSSFEEWQHEFLLSNGRFPDAAETWKLFTGKGPDQTLHPDDMAVDRFAEAMKEKLAKAREKGRSGWETCPPEELSQMLREHVEKGDPRDVANFAMMLWNLQATVRHAPVSTMQGQADAHLRALLRYTENFYSTAIAHGMKAGPTADSVAHVERSGKALHQLVHAQAKMRQSAQQQEPVPFVWGYAVRNPKEPAWPAELVSTESHAKAIAAHLYRSEIIPLVAYQPEPLQAPEVS